MIWGNSRDAKVANLDGTIISDKKVCRLNVAVDDANLMEELQTTKRIVNHGEDVG